MESKSPKGLPPRLFRVPPKRIENKGIEIDKPKLLKKPIMIIKISNFLASEN